MRRFRLAILSLILMGASPILAGPPPDHPAIPAVENNISGAPPSAPDKPFPFKKEIPEPRARKGRLHWNMLPRLESGADRRDSPNERESESEQVLRNNLARFGNRDDHGGLLFSFYKDRVEFGARSVTGERDWIIRLDAPSQ